MHTLIFPNEQFSLMLAGGGDYMSWYICNSHVTGKKQDFNVDIQEVLTTCYQKYITSFECTKSE